MDGHRDKRTETVKTLGAVNVASQAEIPYTSGHRREQMRQGNVPATLGSSGCAHSPCETHDRNACTGDSNSGCRRHAARSRRHSHVRIRNEKLVQAEWHTKIFDEREQPEK